MFVGNKNPLWVCPNAMKKDKNCIYALCNNCHMEKMQPRTSKKKMKAFDSRTGCNHHNLNCFADEAYFTQSYRTRCVLEKYHTPSTCSNCNKLLTSEKNVASV